MNDFDDYLRGELRHLRAAVSAAHSEPERIALVSRVQERSRTRRLARAMAIASLAALVVVAGTVLALSSSDRAPDDGPPVVAPEPSRAPSPSPSTSPSLSDPNVGRVVYVFLLPEDGDAYDRSDYIPEERPVGAGAGTEARLRTALTELVASWSAETVGLINSVEVADGRARVEFHDFRKIIPWAGTSYGGVAFQFSLNLTVFQFDGIDEVVYSIEGDCLAFWEFLQSGECRPPLTRDAWDNAGIESEP